MEVWYYISRGWKPTSIEKENDTKDLALVLLIAAVFGVGAFAYGAAAQASSLRLELEAQRAIATTGPCGSQFVVSGLGKNKDEAAVAGGIVKTDEVGRFFQKEEEIDGQRYIAVYEKDRDGRESFHFRRPK